MSNLKKKKGKSKAQRRKTRNRHLTVPVIIVVTDGGDFGFDQCGACHYTITSRPTVCPYCGAKLSGTEISSPTGGSDF